MQVALIYYIISHYRKSPYICRQRGSPAQWKAVSSSSYVH
jgi:hypothetical protein